MQKTDSVLVSIEELSKKLNVPKTTIYYWVQNKKVPFFKAGRHLRFDLDEILKHLHVALTISNSNECSSSRSLTIEEKFKQRRDLLKN